LKATQQIQARTAAEILTMRTELVSRLEQVKAGMDGFSRAADSSAGASANAFSQTTNAIRTSAERQAASMQQVAALLKKLQDDDVSELRQELAKVREQMATQHKLLEALSKRKGFTF
jgi:2-oxoglutarate dehydrogenase complex dehydrogenase (E1) component-like enzyme